MRAIAAPTADRDEPPRALSRSELAFDVALAAACAGVAMVINLSGSESVAANRDPDALTVSLTVLAVGSIALRRRFPLGVLVLTVTAVFGLVLVKGTVGAATIGPFIAAYTCVAVGSARNSRRAIVVVILTLVLMFILDPVDLSNDGAVLNSALFAGVILLGTTTRARRDRAESEVRAAQQRVLLERERADAERERASLTATQERLRITRELHDVIGHAMSVMVVQSGAAGRLLDTSEPDRARAAVGEIERTGRAAMAEMRSLLGVLRHGETEGEGFPRAPSPTIDDVTALVARVAEAGLPTTIAWSGTRVELTPGVGLSAYRIVQEALTNCLKHSGAAHASVEVNYRPGEVEIAVADDGRGLPEGKLVPTPGHGLAGMRERVAAYGGDFTIGGRAEGGFRVHATFPTPAAP